MKKTFSEILSTLDDVRPDGSTGYVAICPAHEDTNPSLRLAFNSDTGKVLVTCRSGCDKDDVLKALGLTVRDLFEVKPGDLANLKTTKTEMAEVGPADIAGLRMYLDRTISFSQTETIGDLARDYALTRFGITADAFDRLGLGADPGSLPSGNLILSATKYHDTARLVVPFNRFNGVAHYLQARALEGKPPAKWSGPANPEGSAWGKYGWFQSDTSWSDVLIAEGPGDALTAVAVGYDTLAIRGAGLASNSRLMDEIAEHLQGRRVVVAGDNDAAGQEFTSQVARALSERGLKPLRLNLPEGVNDLTDWRESVGASAFPKTLVTAVSNATPYGADQIVAEEILQDVTRLFSDVYNAQTLLRQVTESGADIRYTSAMGFLVYQPVKGVWEVDGTEWIRRQAHQVAERVQKAILAEMSNMDAKVAAIEDKALREAVGKAVDAHRRRARSGSIITNLLSQRGIDAMLRELRALEGVTERVEDFDQHPHLLPCRNGVVNLETGALQPYSDQTKALLLMRHVDIDFNPDAKNPRWERFVEEIFDGQPDLAAYLQRLVGYGVTGYTSEQMFAVLYGTGANGKSVFTDTLATIFEGITATAAFETFEQQQGSTIRQDIARLNGARLVMTEEGRQGEPMAENTLKLLTGQGKVTTRFLYQKEFEFHPSFLILMASNYKPNFRGQDEGIWRRVRLVPFNRYFAPEERDKYLAAKFTGQVVPRSAWRPGEDYGDGPAGILAWAVRGAHQWFADGLADPETVKVGTEEYRRTSDVLGPFYSEFLVRDPEGKITAKRAWELYQKWADEESLQGKDRWKRSTFLTALEERGAVKKSSGGAFYYRGIREVKPSDKAAPPSTSGDDVLG